MAPPAKPRRPKPVKIKHHKQRGEWAEMHFMARATEHGLRVTKPWGDSSRYDFAVEYQGRFLRVQVKSTTCKLGNSYICNIRSSGGESYDPRDVDFFACYAIEPDVWYIVPSKIAAGVSTGLMLSPHSPGSKYDAYKEAWHLLRESPKKSSAATEHISAQPPNDDAPASGTPPTEDLARDDKDGNEESDLPDTLQQALGIKWEPKWRPNWPARGNRKF
jgi:hypothetical protein